LPLPQLEISVLCRTVAQQTATIPRVTEVHHFEFNPFGENTYIVFDESKECAIFDPGCFGTTEQNILRDFIESRQLRPVRLINTHCHLDHVFGNRFVADTWGLGLEIHRGELPVLERFPDVALMYGISQVEPSPMPAAFLEAGETVVFGNTHLEILFTPGHSPASLSFYCREAGFVLAGDVLFYESIGRYDLPGGNFDILVQSIHSQLFTLPPETIVYAGHGPTTTIRHEREYNPFL
jgi:glyoxylase-like metal-dependent hydrolase (beta-lactamase superfamily II)